MKPPRPHRLAYFVQIDTYTLYNNSKIYSYNDVLNMYDYERDPVYSYQVNTYRMHIES